MSVFQQFYGWKQICVVSVKNISYSSSIILVVSETDCTTNGKECEEFKNSHCDTDKCKCDDGFVMNANVCSADNGGNMYDMTMLNVRKIEIVSYK